MLRVASRTRRELALLQLEHSDKVFCNIQCIWNVLSLLCRNPGKSSYVMYIDRIKLPIDVQKTSYILLCNSRSAAGSPEDILVTEKCGRWDMEAVLLRSVSPTSVCQKDLIL